MKRRRLIFLDIDGVLGHFGSDGRLDPRCIAELDQLIAETGAHVILISSWRETIGLAESRRRLAAAGFRGRIADATPSFPHRTRSDEIEAFLIGYPSQRFVILDDMPTSPRLAFAHVLIDEFTGLTALEASAAKRILMCPRSPP
jgi:hypothetical protein